MDSEKQSSQSFGDFLFPKIFQTFRMAIQPSKLIIAFAAVAVICLAGWIMDSGNTVIAGSDGTTELQVYLGDPGRVPLFIETNQGLKSERRGVFSTMWHFAATKFHGLLTALFAFDIGGIKANILEYCRATTWAFRYHPVYCAILGVIKLAVISIAGGSLCRIAALQFARDEKPGLTEAVRFSAGKFWSLFTAPLAPLGITVFIGLFIFFLGLICNIPRAGELITAIFVPLALIAGGLIAILLIGTVAGFNLMFPAVAYDGSDCFDAVSRAFSYVYGKPWRMAFYTAIAAVYGAICYAFVRFFTFLLLWVARWSLELGIWVDNSSKEAGKLTALWPPPGFMNLPGSSSLSTVNWSEWVAAFLINLVLLAVIGLLVSFIISFYFSANTIIYALMRNRVDNTALEDIYTPSEAAQAEPATPPAAESESQESKAETETPPDSVSPPE